jgi:hypothetical protein
MKSISMRMDAGLRRNKKMDTNKTWGIATAVLAIINFICKGDTSFTIIMIGCMLLFRINDLETPVKRKK